jgi:hypothetical protein
MLLIANFDVLQCKINSWLLSSGVDKIGAVTSAILSVLNATSSSAVYRNFLVPLARVLFVASCNDFAIAAE